MIAQPLYVPVSDTAQHMLLYVCDVLRVQRYRNLYMCVPVVHVE